MRIDILVILAAGFFASATHTGSDLRLSYIGQQIVAKLVLIRKPKPLLKRKKLKKEGENSEEKEYSLIQAIENKHNSDSPGEKNAHQTCCPSKYI